MKNRNMLAEHEVLNATRRLREAQILELQQFQQPHRWLDTFVFWDDAQEKWICTTRDHEPDDLLGKYPYGTGNSPSEACQDFDEVWSNG